MASVLPKGQDETGRLAERGTNGPEDIGRGGALILQGERSRAAFGHRRVILFFLADAGFVLEPDFEGLPVAAAMVARSVGTFFERRDNRLVMLVMTGRAESFR